MEKNTKIFFAINFLIIIIVSYTFYELLNNNKKTLEINLEELNTKISDSNIARADQDYGLRLEIQQSKINLQQSKINLEQEVLKLEMEIKSLETEVESLENKLKELDKTTYKIELKSSKPSVKWMNLSNWRKLRKGLNEEQVIGLLGSPTRRMANTHSSVTLLYQEYGKRGSVVIEKFLGVSTWSEPIIN